MSQLIAGTTYSTGSQVTAVNLNAHVTEARLTSGAISEQTAASSIQTVDNVLLLQSGFLRKGTISQILDAAGQFIKSNGSVAMTGELTLSGNPTNTVSAAPKSYVDQLASVVPINSQSGITYTLQLSDAGKLIVSTGAVNLNLTIPTNSVAFAIGSQLLVTQSGAGRVIVSALTPATTTVSGRNGLRTAGIDATIVLLKVGAERWIINGDASF